MKESEGKGQYSIHNEGSNIRNNSVQGGNQAGEVGNQVQALLRLGKTHDGLCQPLSRALVVDVAEVQGELIHNFSVVTGKESAEDGI